MIEVISVENVIVQLRERDRKTKSSTIEMVT